MKEKTTWKILLPIIMVCISIYVSLCFKLTVIETIIIGLQSFMTGIIVDLFYDNLSSKKDFLSLQYAHLQLIRISKFYREFLSAIKDPNPLFRKFLIQEINNFEQYFSKASNGQISLRSKNSLLIYYGDFFEIAESNSTIRATIVSVPSRDWFQAILSAHIDFISNKSGHVDRIFIISPDDLNNQEKQSCILEFMEKQKNIGINVLYVNTYNIDDSLIKDIMILSEPYMGNIAYPLNHDYLEADLITNKNKLKELEGIWENLTRLYARPYISNNELFEYFNIYSKEV